MNYRILITKSKIAKKWLCRLIPEGYSAYDEESIFVGRYDTQSIALQRGYIALKFVQTTVPWNERR